MLTKTQGQDLNCVYFGPYTVVLYYYTGVIGWNCWWKTLQNNKIIFVTNWGRPYLFSLRFFSHVIGGFTIDMSKSNQSVNCILAFLVTVIKPIIEK